MSTDAAAHQTATAATSDHSGLFFELENVGANGPQILLDVVKAAVSDAGGKFNHAAFARIALHARPEAFAGALLQACGASGDAARFAATIRDGVTKKLLASSAISGGMLKLIHAAEARGMAIGVISALPEALHGDLLRKLGLDPEKVKVQGVKEDDDKTFPRADLWLKLARQAGRPSRACVVLAGSRVGCKSALSAGLRCIAIPHPLCAHEDVSGADVILDTWDEMSANEILDAVVPEKSV